MPPESATLDYLLFDPEPFDFPPARIPVMPPLRFGAIRRRSDVRAVPAWGAAARFYGRGRYALHDAYQLSGVGSAGALLAPAYHCRTMIDPALALGAPVRFYALDEALRPDLSDMARQLSEPGTPVKAVVASHFFGMAQDLREIAALCERRGVALVEDCAQSLPLSAPTNGMGKTGTWCVASPWKFYPCEDGGVLWAGVGHMVDLPRLRKPSLRAELSELSRMWRHAQVSRGSGETRPPAPSRAPTREEIDAQSIARRITGPSRDYAPEREPLGCSAISRWIVAHTDSAELLAKRRANYERLAAAAKDFPRARALRPMLGANDTPYMFPLLIEEPDGRFPALKRAGLPIWRWDSLASSHCLTATSYRLRLLHLPCHQALTDADLDWMVRTLATVLGASSPRRGAA